MRLRWRTILLFAFLLIATGCQVGMPGSVRLLGRVESTAETTQGYDISRDCGWSRKINATQTLWVFCDTFSGISDGSVWREGPLSFRGTAAISDIGTLGRPQELRELASPIEYLLPLSDPCPPESDRPNLLRWPMGLGPARADGKVVIFHVDSCFFGGEMRQVRWGGSLYDPATHSVSQPIDVFRADHTEIPRQAVMSSTVLHGGHLYFIAPGWNGERNRLGNYLTGLARVPVDQWRRAGAYRWWDGTRWQARPQAMAGLPIDDQHFQSSMNTFPVPYEGDVMLISQQAAEPGRFGGVIDVYSIADLARPSVKLLFDEVRVDACSKRCYHFFAHPEYGGPNHTILSYFNVSDRLPGDAGRDWRFPSYGHTQALRLELGPHRNAAARPRTPVVTPRRAVGSAGIRPQVRKNVAAASRRVANTLAARQPPVG